MADVSIKERREKKKGKIDIGTKYFLFGFVSKKNLYYIYLPGLRGSLREGLEL
jgi:hypothetical protein